MNRRTPPTLRAVLATAVTVALAAAGAGTIAAPVAAAASTPGTVTIGGKCLDDADFNTANGAVVQIFTCNGASAQNWTWQDDGRLTVTVGSTTKCLDVTGGSNANGALVQLYDCTSGAAQQKFTYLPDGTIYSAKSGKCLAVQGGSIVNNARIGLAECDPSQAVQKWGSATAPVPRYLFNAGSGLSFPNGDDSPAFPYIDANGTFYYQSAHALYGNDPRKWSFWSGADFDSATLDPISSAVNPANSQDRNDDTTWRCNNSPTGLTATAAPTGTTYTQRNYCDLVGVWVDPDTGWWYGLVHNEFTGSPFGDGLHFDAIDSAVSKDHGNTWTIQDHALTSPYSTTRGDTAAFPQQTYYYGDGDQRLFTDYASGYFYVFYATRVVTKPGTSGGSVWQQHVARAPISGKMAANSWSKWYNGAWQQPGVGGAESNIIPADGGGTGYTAPGDEYKPTTTGGATAQVAAGTMPGQSPLTVMNIAWSAYLGKYIGTPQNNIAQNTGVNTPLHFYATDDLATQKWTDLGLVPGTENGSWYRWLLDSGSRASTTVLGKTFRSYCSIECGTSSREITVSPRSSSDLPQAPVNSGRTYQIAAGNGQYLAQSGSTLTTAGSSGSTTQQWKFTATGDGFFTVTNVSSGQALGVGTGNAGRAWGAPVTATAAGTAVGQQWSVQAVTTAPTPSGAATPTGAYRLVNRYSGLALSLTAPGAQSVVTSPQRSWNNTGSSGDTRPVNAQTLTFTAVGGTATNTVTVGDPGDRTTSPGTAITPVQVTGSDSAAGQTLSWSATGLPQGLSITSGGQITGTPIAVGTKTVTITATDTTGATGSTTLTWTVPGTDAARGRPAAASSVEANSSSLTAAMAVDGNPTTRWASAYSDPQWLQVDLGSVKPVKQVTLSWEAAYGKAYQIQTSTDGTTWTTVHSTTTGTGGTETLTNLNGSGRYVRMYGTQRGSSFGYSLYSMEVYGW
ncbi:ricin-type beta-trefoil lectin domain protein [Kitasatospora sp. NPDC048365]|uniref:ricin-type beta-trefoil lectin domain protein n=1 Tax=Kitasatospora sp. NPDC048365 TaxID=3364050 RepID=UPI00371757CD